jgi:hypothetical protein
MEIAKALAGASRTSCKILRFAGNLYCKRGDWL